MVTPVKPAPSTSPEPDDSLAATGLRTSYDRSSSADRSPGSWPSDDGPENELPVPEGHLVGGRYSVERIFAEGGMGIVCMGRHAQLEQTVAIKFLRLALSGKPSVVERFLNEGRALAALRSEHVVRVMDVGQLDSGRPYLVMEHLEGIDLDGLVDRDGPLDIETAVNYVLQVCEPLAEAHALGIVHRDIKPENLFLWSGGPGRDIVKVLDFGVAKQIGASRSKGVTGPQDSIGSPCYMSPEQIVTPQGIDSRTDIWSLGVVLHRLLTDTLPFDGSSIMEVLSHVLSAAPKSLAEARPELGSEPELEAIVRRCLEKERDARYQSMTELAEALTGFLAHRGAVTSESVPPPPAPSRNPPGRVYAGDDEPIRIAGVRSRWPAVLLVGVALAAAALYQADRSGRVHVRRLAAGWLTPARLAADSESVALEGNFQPDFGIARGIFAAESTREANGALALRAQPEVDSEVTAADARATQAASAPMSDEERARKEAAYRDYLTNQGLTPIREELEKIDETAPAN